MRRAETNACVVSIKSKDHLIKISMHILTNFGVEVNSLARTNLLSFTKKLSKIYFFATQS